MARGAFFYNAAEPVVDTTIVLGVIGTIAGISANSIIIGAVQNQASKGSDSNFFMGNVKITGVMPVQNSIFAMQSSTRLLKIDTGTATSPVMGNIILVADNALTADLPVSFASTSPAGNVVIGSPNRFGLGGLTFGNVVIGNNTQSNYGQSQKNVVIGDSCTVSYINSIAIGNSCSTSSNNVTMAIGSSCSATGNGQSLAIGFSASGAGTSVVSIGNSCTAPGTNQISIGKSSVSNASADNTITIGTSATTNNASALNAIAIGQTATCTAASSIAIGGGATFGANDNGKGSAVSILNAQPRNNGAFAFQPGSWGATGLGAGVAQWEIASLFVSTTDATQTELLMSTGRLVMPNNSCWFFNAYIVAHRSDAQGDQMAWRVEGAISRGANAAATALVGTPSTSTFNSGSLTWSISVTADTTNGALVFKGTGEAAKTIKWLARVDTVEMTA